MTDIVKQNRATAIAIIGGTGALGTGLARRWAEAGHALIIGSRSRDKAQAAATAIDKRLAGRGLQGPAVRAMVNEDAAAAADLVVLTVPFAHHGATLESIRAAVEGKILVDVTVPLVPPKVGTVQLPPAGSAAVMAQAMLGSGVRVVSALQNVAAALLQSDGDIDCDILVCGNDRDARHAVIALLADAGMRGLHAGPIANSAASEALTSVLITINRTFKSHAGIRVTGLAEDP
ncbi:MAG TPA: NADPH-dependent F420 reductase [Woeseiaceae bacterium]|nr:NADPH-dependent F420 reductase [Woeseiaceae bacterium]